MDNDIVKSHQSTNRTNKLDENKLSLNANESGSDSLKFFENGIRSEWCNTKEAAQILCLSENSIRIMVHRGQISYYKIGRRLRFKYSELVQLFTKGGTSVV